MGGPPFSAKALRARRLRRRPGGRALGGLGLNFYYARVYKLASDVVHYSIGGALGGFLIVSSQSATTAARNCGAGHQ
jgi:hypothetical protein